MIKYSITMRSAHPGTLAGEITEKKAYANVQQSETITLEAFAKHISTHGSVYGRADIQAILTLASDCLREMLLEGKKVEFGDIGAFRINLKSKGARNAAEFTADNITTVSVNWKPGLLFRNLRPDAQFEFVPTRDAVDELCAQQKAQSTQGTGGSGMEAE